MKLITSLPFVVLLFTMYSCSWFEPKCDNIIDVHGNPSGYYITKNKKYIYVSSYDPLLGSYWEKVRDVNVKSFIALNKNCGKDDKHVFCEDKMISDPTITSTLDIESFIVDEKGYPKDKNHVYRITPLVNHLQMIKGANPETFEGMDSGFLSRDGKHYFYFDTMIDIADYDSFVFFDAPNECYAKDKYHVYMVIAHYPFEAETLIIRNANPETFEIVYINFGHTNADWSKDDKHYFFRGKQSDIDYDSFEVIYGGVVIDKNHVYSNGKIIDKTVGEARAESEERFRRNHPDTVL